VERPAQLLRQKHLVQETLAHERQLRRSANAPSVRINTPDLTGVAGERWGREPHTAPAAFC
jgi:hypothetical protein